MQAEVGGSEGGGGRSWGSMQQTMHGEAMEFLVEQQRASALNVLDGRRGTYSLSPGTLHKDAVHQGPYRKGIGVAAAAAAEPLSLEHCSHDMSSRAIPALNESLVQTFGDGIALEDVKILQAQTTTVERPSPVVLTNGSYIGDGQPPMFRKLYEDSGKSANTLLGGTCMLGQLLEEGLQQHVANGNLLRDAYICKGGAQCLFQDDLEAVSTLINGSASGEVRLRSTDLQRTLLSGQTLTATFFDVAAARAAALDALYRPDANVNGTGTGPFPNATADSQGASGNDTGIPIGVDLGLLTGDALIVPWHTGDYAVDRLYTNEQACPRLTEIAAASSNSPEFIEEFHKSPNVRALNESIKAAWGINDVDWKITLDCTITTACTGNALPPDMTPELVASVLNISTFVENYKHFYNDNEFAKLLQAPLMAELCGHVEFAKLSQAPLIAELRGHVEVATSALSTSKLKFGLWAGHDNTLMPLMAAIASSSWGEGSKWVPYASMVVLELYQWVSYASTVLLELYQVANEAYVRLIFNGSVLHVVANEAYVRLIFNGAVLHMDGGCAGKDLCAVQDFLELTAFVQDPAATNCTAALPPAVPAQTPLPTEQPTAEPVAPEVVPPVPTAPPTEKVLPGGTTGPGGPDDAQANQYSGQVVVAFSLACFIIGLLTGAAPLIIFQRRFNYEAVGGADTAVDSGGYQYQMPEISNNVRRNLETFA
ncbi:histidine phosphatase superfamily [Tribonema minus]|uniref:Histidine phosphatase superfamily n=1 Tax=Tribonema minus TaxID=303371 RepID=A0A835YSM2_9STRA|nr:histidine phosphatase superfamily [Tribonema minus]